MKEAPQILRVKEPPLLQTEFTQDPELIKLNQQLTIQIEESLQLEQTAKERAARFESENISLKAKIQELESRPARVVVKERIVEKVERIQPQPVGPRLELLFSKFKSYHDDVVRSCVFQCLRLNAESRKFQRLSESRKEKVLVNQKLEIVDGTLQVFEHLRSSLSKIGLDIFIQSMDKASQRHMNSFKLFQTNLNEAKKKGLHSFITFGIYSRLKNLVQDEIPQLNWQEKYSYMEREIDGNKAIDLKNLDLDKV